MKVKILFDLLNAQPAKGSKFHGGGEYIKTVFRKLVADYSQRMELTVFYDPERFLDDWIKDMIAQYGIPVLQAVTEKDVAAFPDLQQYDVFYSGLPYQYRREWLPEHTAVLGTIHGLRALEKAEDTYDYLYTSGSDLVKRLRKAKRQVETLLFHRAEKIEQKQLEKFRQSIGLLDTVISVSQHTKYSIMYHYALEESRIKVLYSPRKVQFEITPEDRKICPQGKYLLLIGGDRWLKNACRGILALDRLFSRGQLPGCNVVIVGKVPDSFWKRVRNRGRFQNLGYVSPGELEALYSGCELFVYPSLNEGFGYPPLEAMAYGKTCVVSAVCSLPEVCGDAVYYFNPYDIKEIGIRILTAIENKKPESLVLGHYRKMLEHQEQDLNELCNFLVCEGEKHAQRRLQQESCPPETP